MASLKEICSRIGLQKEVQDIILNMEKNREFFQKDEEIRKLTETENWQRAREDLKESMGEDPRGLKILYCMLKAAVISWEKYQEQGIEEKVFDDTMKCFTRFVEEHKASYGVYGFDRDFWTGRQLSLQLFRLGELEYEKVEEDNGEGIFPSIFPLTQSWIRRRSKPLFVRRKNSLKNRIPPGIGFPISAVPGCSARL